MKALVITLLLTLGLPAVSLADSAAVEGLMADYAEQGAGKPDAQRGKAMWNQQFIGNDEPTTRSCASCHTADLTARGKHVRTGKPIEPLAPAVNPERLTSSKEVEKWFLRNCKWTLGRECSPQEKADFLAYINHATRF